MSAERQRVTLELMGLTMKDGPTTVVGEGRAAKATTSPKPPPPKAPMETYARDPTRRSQNSLGGTGCKGDSEGEDSQGKCGWGDSRRDAKGRNPKERVLKERTKAKIPKAKSPNGWIPKEKNLKGKMRKEGRV